MTTAERDRIHAQVRESRRAQGLPEHITDAAVLDRLAAVVQAAGNGDYNTKAPELTTPEPSTSTPTRKEEVV